LKLLLSLNYMHKPQHNSASTMNCQSDHVAIDHTIAYDANLTIHYILHVCFYPKPSTTGIAFILAVPHIPDTLGTVTSHTWPSLLALHRTRETSQICNVAISSSVRELQLRIKTSDGWHLGQLRDKSASRLQSASCHQQR
jgi:hypothetical protein